MVDFKTDELLYIKGLIKKDIAAQVPKNDRGFVLMIQFRKRVLQKIEHKFT